MRRLISMILAVCLLTGGSIPARAVDMVPDEVPPKADTATAEVATTLDELQEAVALAENGGTIALGKTIYINGETISTDKELTLIRADGFASGDMIVIYNGEIEGFRFQESAPAGIISVWPAQDSKIAIENCIFDGSGVGEGIRITGTRYPHQVTISNCEFSDCYHHSVNAQANTKVSVDGCYIHDGYYGSVGGAVQSSGKLTLTRCTITDNTSWANAGVMCSGGTLVANDCIIRENKILSPDSGIAVDVFCLDTVWSLSNSGNTTDAGYYDLTTGDKVDLPIQESTNFAKLIYLTDEEAEDYFAPPASPDDDANPAPDGNPDIPDDGEEDSSDNDDGEDTDETAEEQQPEVTPPAEGGDGEQPPEPVTPPTDDTGDNDQGGIERPETPVGDDSDSGNYTPSRPHKPTQRPPEPDADTPEETPAPVLICGEAVVDTSRSVVLAGYEDGELHLGDPLTRAQLATVIYRLLAEESIIQYGAGQSVFEDVSADAWYYQAVNTIGQVGIVNGVGNGWYAPDGLVTWVQAIAVLSRFVQAEEYELQRLEYDGWARPAVETAVAFGWIEDSNNIDLNSAITRGEFMEFVNSVIEKYR